MAPDPEKARRLLEANGERREELLPRCTGQFVAVDHAWRRVMGASPDLFRLLARLAERELEAAGLRLCGIRDSRIPALL